MPQHFNNSTYELLPYYSLAYLTNFNYPSTINVKEIVIPDIIKTIPHQTFHGTRSLTKITLPRTITNIQNQIGRETSISDIYYLGTENEWNNIEFGDSWKYDIGKATIYYIGE